MDKRLRIGGIIAAVAFSIIILTSPSEPLPLPEPTTTGSQSDSVEVLATNLKKPRSIAFSDDLIFVTEKDGRIRIIQDDVLLEEPLANVGKEEIPEFIYRKINVRKPTIGIGHNSNKSLKS